MCSNMQPVYSSESQSTRNQQIHSASRNMPQIFYQFSKTNTTQ